MNQLSSFPYSKLRSLSFTQLFSLVIVMARWKWEMRADRYLLVCRARENARSRILLPAHAAVFLCASEEAEPLLIISGVLLNCETGEQDSWW